MVIYIAREEYLTRPSWLALEEEKMLIETDWPEFNEDLLFNAEVEEMELLH